MSPANNLQSIIRVKYYSTTARTLVPYPYDCAHQNTTASNRTKYCLQSRFFSCVTRVHCPVPELGGTCPVDSMARVAAFMACADGKPFESALPCAHEYFDPSDVSPVLKCFDPSDVSPTSPALAAIRAVDDATVAAGVNFYPDVRVNGLRIAPPTADRLIKAVCATYNGTAPPPACSPAEA